MADSSYPDDLLYHAEHDWARIDADGSSATLGITWYAQDSLGEVVFFDLPAVGTSITKDAPYAEVESSLCMAQLISARGITPMIMTRPLPSCQGRMT